MRIVCYIYKGYRGGKHSSRGTFRYVFETTNDGASVLRIWDGKQLKNKKARAVIEISVNEAEDDLAELSCTLVELASVLERKYLNFKLTSSEIVDMHEGRSRRAAKEEFEKAFPGLKTQRRAGKRKSNG